MNNRDIDGRRDARFTSVAASAQSLGSTPAASGVEINKVIRNTWMLLGMTLAWSAVVATLAMALRLPPLGPIVTLVGYFALLFGVHKTANSAMGIWLVFALTGFMGLTLGPIIGFYLSLPNGSSLVISALGTTALAFVGLSAFAVFSRRDFEFLRGFLTVGVFVLLGIVLASLVFDLSAFQGAIAGGIVLLSCALILWQTSAIVNGGETNYVLATVSLFVSIYNLFLSLLQIFGMGGDD